MKHYVTLLYISIVINAHIVAAAPDISDKDTSRGSHSLITDTNYGITQAKMLDIRTLCAT